MGEKIYDVPAAVELRSTKSVLAHQNNWNAGEHRRERLDHVVCLRADFCHMGLNDYDSECDVLFFDNGPFESHFSLQDSTVAQNRTLMSSNDIDVRAKTG